MSIKKILIRYWGYSSFRPLQEEIIESVLEGKDTLALLPTGGGKSICFQVPALALNGVCIVVTPLIALMKDQVEGMKKKGINADAVYSGMTTPQIDRVLDNAVYGDLKFLYLSPERLKTDLFLERFKKMKVGLIAVDEAHCISQWGYDFRPPYLEIAKIRVYQPDVPVIALTATATPEVVTDIMEKLEFPEPNLFQKSFARDNLTYMVIEDENKLQRLIRIINRTNGSGIVYVRNRKQCKEIAEWLRSNGIIADYYHAGLNQQQRSDRQDAWIRNKTRIIVSTNAFGMGIDKPDVRIVVHLDLPDTPEAYFQEAGRGGRDEQRSFAVMLVEKADINKLNENFKNTYPEPELIKRVYNALGNAFQIAEGAGENMSFDFDLEQFCESFRLERLKTWYAIKVLEKEGLVAMNPGMNGSSKLIFKVNREQLYNFQFKNPSVDSFIRLLLRSYQGLFNEYVKISEETISKRSGMDQERVVKALNYLNQSGIADYLQRKTKPQLSWLLPRIDQKYFKLQENNYLNRKEAAKKRIDAMIHYVESTAKCRSQILLEYFGEMNSQRCGQCDVCLRRNKMELSELEFNKVIDQLKPLLQAEPQSMAALLEKLRDVEEEDLIRVIDWLVDNEKVGWFGDRLVWGR